MHYDFLIKNGTVIDGSKAERYVSDIGVLDGKIVIPVSEHDTATNVVDASGKIVCPGFIDSHSHIDEFMIEDTARYAFCKISQGITTEVAGQCGESLFPVTRQHEADLRSLNYSNMPKELSDKLGLFSSFSSYLAYIRSLSKVQNYAFNCGHSTLRTAVMGLENRKPTNEEMEQMKQLLRECMEHGCTGLSTGLIYIPGTYADTDEIIELCKVVKEYNGIYCTHMRSESDHVIEAVEEAVQIAESSGVSLVISHHKTAGRKNFGLSKETLRIVDEARDRGCRVYLDQYPYTAACTNIDVLIPPQYFSDGMENLCKRLREDGFRKKVKQEIATDTSFDNFYINCGDFTNILVLSAPETPEACGKTIQEYADLYGKDPFDAYLDLLIDNHLYGLAAFFYVCEEDLERIYQYKNTVVGSDCLISLDGSPVHPRTYGAFIKPITHFVKEKQIMSLEEVIHKQTAMTAECWHIPGKGLIRKGYDADIVIFDYDELEHTPTYQNPAMICQGIEKVFVNGKVVFDDGQLTGEYSGKEILCVNDRV